MTAVYRLSSGDPYAVTIHPEATVTTWLEGPVLEVRFEHGWKPPVTVLLPSEAAVNTAIALTHHGKPLGHEGDSGTGAGVEKPPVPESTTCPREQGGGTADVSDE